MSEDVTPTRPPFRRRVRGYCAADVDVFFERIEERSQWQIDYEGRFPLRWFGYDMDAVESALEYWGGERCRRVGPDDFSDPRRGWPWLALFAGIPVFGMLAFANLTDTEPDAPPKRFGWMALAAAVLLTGAALLGYARRYQWGRRGRHQGDPR